MLSTQGVLYWIYLLAPLFITVLGDECIPGYCNSGKCTLTNKGKIHCFCTHGWRGRRCEENIDNCMKNSCENGGKCIDQINSRYICKCPLEYVGERCQFFNPCISKSPCKNGGQCEPMNDGKYTCRCKEGFMGNMCEESKVKCSDNLNETRENCNNNGVCQIDENQKLSCKCDTGYYGERCEQRMIYREKVRCIDGFCLNGECEIRQNGVKTCKCVKGWFGSQCQFKENAGDYAELKRQILQSSVTVQNSPSFTDCKMECRNLIGNGICDKQCNTKGCKYDGGDCDPWQKCRSKGLEHCRFVFNDGKCNPECNSVDCLFDGEDCQRTKCQNYVYCAQVFQNNICNEECNNPQCGFDGGDCQIRNANSFFSVENFAKCSAQTKIFELDLVLLTSVENFNNHKSEFLQKLSSLLKMVVEIAKIEKIHFNNVKAIRIKLHINHTQCILYGGQCFSNLDQISNFIKAGIKNGKAISLPFQVAMVETHVVKKKQIRSTLQLDIMILGIMGFGIIITFILVVVLLRDKWGKLRTKIRSTGVWTPNGYSTSTSSINSGPKPDWASLPQIKDFKKQYTKSDIFLCDGDNMKISQMKVLPDANENDKISSNYNRKRKYEIKGKNKASTFQLISDFLENTDGIHPIESRDLYDIATGKSRSKPDERNQSTVLNGLGDYVNENGESLMHIGARMNCGPSLIKQLNTITPSMLQSLDEWGRTPLATSIASEAVESAGQLIVLEKQFRKESKLNKSRLGSSGISAGVSCEYLVKRTTALIESVKLNSKDLINLLLDEGNSINVFDTLGRSVVHWGATFNNVSLLERLSRLKIFQKLADLKDFEDKTPLYLAANEGALEAVKFLLEYFNKNSIKIDSNCPCPKQIAAEKGFQEISDLISETLRKVIFLENNGKRMKLKDNKLQNKISYFDNPPSNLGINDEYRDPSGHSNENCPNSLVEKESIDSCLMELYSIAVPSSSNHNDFNSFSSFKPVECKYQGYQSNTSSSDMSPPLLNLNNSHLHNGFNPVGYSDSMDFNFSNPVFMSFQSDHQGNKFLNSAKSIDHTIEACNFPASPLVSKCQHYPSMRSVTFSSPNVLL